MEATKDGAIQKESQCEKIPYQEDTMSSHLFDPGSSTKKVDARDIVRNGDNRVEDFP